MRLGVFTPLFGHLSFELMLEKVRSFGLDCVEIGTGAYPGSAHCDVDALLADRARAGDYLGAIRDAGLSISALSCHGNPVHPDPAIAGEHHEVFEKTVRLAALLEVPVINVLSGCPGDSETARAPNWVTCAWPPDYPPILEWQWNRVVIPYWRKAAAFAEQHGIRKIAVEMHPGFVVYNPETALKLREAVGETIGVNLDPSHLFWQGIDVPTAIRGFGQAGALFHVHAKDTFIDPRNTAENGCLDAKPYTQMRDRSWYFRSVGWGHDLLQWRQIVSALRLAGYDYVLSIEHEDGLASVDEGLRYAVEFLRQVLLREQPAEMWWA
jgi:sugar phosphate isomerase/epimerase